MVVVIPGTIEASPVVPPSISTLEPTNNNGGIKGGSVFDEEFRKQATPIDELNELCFKNLASKATSVEDLMAAPAAIGAGSSGSVAEVSCASSTGSISGNLSDGANGVGNGGGGADRHGISEQINAKLMKRTISRHGRSSQRWAADPLSHSAVRLTTGCVPILDGGKVLFVSASSKPLWIFPKGGWEKDEAQEESASREAFEEAGVLGVLGQKLTDVQYETRKSKKRRLDTEELLKKRRERPLIPREDSISNNIRVATAIDAANTAGNSSEAATPCSPLVADAVVVDTTTTLKEPPAAAPPVPVAHNNAAPVSDEAFARIRAEMLKKRKPHFDEASLYSIQSDASSSYSHVRMCLYPLYITSVKKEWPENGRLRRAVPIDEAIEILRARPELQAALIEVKEKGLHLLSNAGIPSSTQTDAKPLASPAVQSAV